MKRQFSCADFTFPLLPHPKALALLRLLDFDAVDLGVFAGRSHIQPADICADVPAAVSRMRESLDRCRLLPGDVFLQTGEEPAQHAANSPDPAIRSANRATFRAMLEFALGIGCRHLTGLPGVWHADAGNAAAGNADDWALAVEEAAWRKGIAADHGIEYAVEPHVGSILPSPQSALDFAAESGVSLTLDYGHFVYQGMDIHAADPLLPLASHFHARGGAPGQLQSSMKENVIDFPDILRRMDAIGYAGAICLEYVWVDWEGCNRSDNLSETLLLRKLMS